MCDRNWLYLLHRKQISISHGINLTVQSSVWVMCDRNWLYLLNRKRISIKC